MIDTILAIDPGKFHLGWALFSAGDPTLLAAGVSRVAADRDSTPDVRGRRRVSIHPPIACSAAPRLAHDVKLTASLHVVAVGTVVAEIPKHYVHGRLTSVPSEDLTWLSLTVGAVVGAIQPDVVQLVEPREWKGTRPKEVCHAAILKRLSEYETTKIHTRLASDRSHALDAVGIGLWSVSRF